MVLNFFLVKKEEFNYLGNSGWVRQAILARSKFSSLMCVKARYLNIYKIYIKYILLLNLIIEYLIKCGVFS